MGFTGDSRQQTPPQDQDLTDRQVFDEVQRRIQARAQSARDHGRAELATELDLWGEDMDLDDFDPADFEVFAALLGHPRGDGQLQAGSAHG